VASRSQLWQGWQKLPTMPAALARQRAMLWTGRQALPQMSPAAAQFQATNPNAAKLWSGYRDLPKYSAAEARDRALHPPGPPPPRPPAGTYDPALDAARRAATRGYGDVKQANVSGVIGGGALMEAATKRQANQAIEQAPLDTSYARAGQDRDLSIQRLGVGFQRGETDRGTALSRAGREDRAFGLDTAAEKMYQATQSGWVPPAKKPPAKKPPAAKKKKK
jgi:hypothetical protein